MTQESLRAALAAETDDGEPLRWSGFPSPELAARVMWRRLLFLVVIGAFFGLLFLLLSAATAREFHLAQSGVRPWTHTTPRGWDPAINQAAMGALFLISSVVGPWIAACLARAEARRTIYALTNTRLIRIQLSRKGEPKVFSVEPGHPLSIQRTLHPNGRGDIHLYPPAGLMQFIGIEEPRNVERLIRETFDPPGSTPRAR